jgi:NAD(P)-dependent dehydrogenase (short-subunit alcohol dehydrogenase family)
MPEAPYFNLKDKGVLVAGGAGDIGKVIVDAFARQGAKVAIGDLDFQKARGIAQSLDTFDVTACRMDITSEASIQEAVAFAEKSCGAVDVLVNVAGILCRKSVFETTKKDFDDSFAVNVTGMFLVSREVALRMRTRRHGVIVNISSMNSKLAIENRIVYAATKAAVNMVTQSLAVELASDGITVNAVAPGVVDSKMARVRLNTPELIRKFSESIPLGRLTLPEDVAYCVLFLASPYAKNISGEIVVVDGALTARMSLPKPG